ncbi:hypothetical protein DSO57_1039701 [Entomophthora muscae]|uniref:Uncharacterized protein n=1 Tax=Entomophthora muscae TaxID=34485 RepID=A0ACC2SD16_9FUNG|nr:hypothetical protein DSO57_1039701 [Entomophthora muscae]
MFPPNNMKFIFLVWTLCVLINYGQANINFKNPEPTPTDKSEDSIWYRFGLRQRHAPYIKSSIPTNHPPQGPLVGLGVHQRLLSSQSLHFLLGEILSIWSPSTHVNDRNSSRFHSDQIQLGSSSSFNWGKASQ